MTVRKFGSFFLLFAFLLTMLCGCGSKYAATGAMVNDTVAETADGYAYAAGTETDSKNSLSTSALPDNRKWVITMDIDTETEDMDTALDLLNQKVLALGGYIQDQRISNGSSYAATRYRNANLTVRVPTEQLDAFTTSLSEHSNVVSSTRSAEDITLSYTDTQTRISALETEQTRLLALMEQAETMSDLLEIEERLTDVNYELERYTSQMRTMDNQVDYATIYLYISEVKEYTPVQEQTLWERIRSGFVASLKGLGNGLVECFAWIVIHLPYLLVYGIILFVIARVVRRIRKHSKAKKSPAAAQSPAQQPDQIPEDGIRQNTPRS